MRRPIRFEGPNVPRRQSHENIQCDLQSYLILRLVKKLLRQSLKFREWNKRFAELF